MSANVKNIFRADSGSLGQENRRVVSLLKEIPDPRATPKIPSAKPRVRVLSARMKRKG
jgi:hypothetical protein